jgi:hypothetical protein
LFFSFIIFIIIIAIKYLRERERERVNINFKMKLSLLLSSVFQFFSYDVPLVLFNEILDHVLRIDRIFRQPRGHLLFVGVSGVGKTTLSRFVAWMNGLSVFQIKVHNNYSSEDFDNDLRNLLRRAGTKSEKIVFMLDESNVLDSGFLERINTLLTNGEVPGLFEGDEYATLIAECKEGAQRDGCMLNSSEELYKWFRNEVMRNLHESKSGWLKESSSHFACLIQSLCAQLVWRLELSCILSSW